MFYKNMFILLSETGLHERCLFKSWRSCCKKSSVKDDLTGAPSLEQDCLAAPAAGGYGKPLGRRVLLDPTSITRLTTGQTVKQKKHIYILIPHRDYVLETREIFTGKSLLVNVGLWCGVFTCAMANWS